MMAIASLLFILTCIPFSITSASIIILPGNFCTHYHEQRVDHFSVVSDTTFKQRIIVSTDHWRRNDGVIFFYTGNEGDILTFANNTGFMWERAQEFGAMIVFAEHRYYGQSLPFGADSFKSRREFGYLTAEQALADFAENIQWLKREYKAPDSPVVVFGGSYGGMLAAWFRVKYPHLAIGALAASAPVWQFPGLGYDCRAYFSIVTKDFADYSEDCVTAIRKSWKVIRDQASSEEGRQKLSQKFNLCPGEELNSNSSVDRFVSWISSAYEYMAMTDYPNAAAFLQPMPAYPIREACKHLTNPAASPDQLLTDVFGAISVFYNGSGSVKCNTLMFNEMDRGWNIQSCVQMVMPICADGVTDMFEKMEFNLTGISERCIRDFGIKPDASLAVREWGGKLLPTATNIIFSNGDRDPWSAGGVTSPPNPRISVIDIPHACHHEDLRSSGPNDPPALREIRDQEAGIISAWISEFRHQQRQQNKV